MERTEPMVVLAVTLLTTAVAVPALAAGVAGAQQSERVDSCTTVTEPGVYELNRSIGAVNGSEAQRNASATETNASAVGTNESAIATNGSASDAVRSCVVVQSSDVVFDGNGNVVAGGNATESNVSVTDAGANVSTPTNATNATAPVVYGITVRPAPGNDTVSNVTIRNVTLRHWDVGLFLRNASGVTLDGVTFENNAVSGFRVENTTGLAIRTGNGTATPAN